MRAPRGSCRPRRPDASWPADLRAPLKACVHDPHRLQVSGSRCQHQPFRTIAFRTHLILRSPQGTDDCKVSSETLVGLWPPRWELPQTSLPTIKERAPEHGESTCRETRVEIKAHILIGIGGGRRLRERHDHIPKMMGSCWRLANTVPRQVVTQALFQRNGRDTSLRSVVKSRMGGAEVETVSINSTLGGPRSTHLRKETQGTELDSGRGTEGTTLTREEGYRTAFPCWWK